MPERVGVSRAKELMFTSRRINGADAAAIGLVDQAVVDENVDDFVTALATEIVQNSAGTNRIYKLLIASRHPRTRDEALMAERPCPFGVPEHIRHHTVRPTKP